jgi:hypothetical protein
VKKEALQREQAQLARRSAIANAKETLKNNMLRGMGRDYYDLLEVTWPQVSHENDVTAQVAYKDMTINIGPMDEGHFYVKGTGRTGSFVEPHLLLDEILDIFYEALGPAERKALVLQMDLEQLSDIPR